MKYEQEQNHAGWELYGRRNAMLVLLPAAQGVDCVIALTHMRTHNDEVLCAQVPAIQLVLGGHDHHFEVSRTQPHGTLLVKSGEPRHSVLPRLPFAGLPPTLPGRLLARPLAGSPASPLARLPARWLACQPAGRLACLAAGRLACQPAGSPASPLARLPARWPACQPAGSPADLLSLPRLRACWPACRPGLAACCPLEWRPAGVPGNSEGGLALLCEHGQLSRHYARWPCPHIAGSALVVGAARSSMLAKQDLACGAAEECVALGKGGKSLGRGHSLPSIVSTIS
jgi:hypothetical protein